MYKNVISAAVVSAATALPAQAALIDIDINIIHGGGLTASQQSVFAAAEAFWEYLIVGYQYDLTAFDANFNTVNITASGVAIDGVGGTLGQAGPDNFYYTTPVGSSLFFYAQDGIMQFDTADLADMEANDTLFDVVVHEMAHVLGYGLAWSIMGDYVPGSGQYTGSEALAAYQAECDPTATFIPVELDGGAGTANSHWDENWACGSNEILTGFLNTPTTLSYTSVASFADLGYFVVDSLPSIASVPLPATGVLLGGGLMGFGAFGARRVRRKRAT